MSSDDTSTTTEPVERFAPTSGRLMGYVGFALSAAALGYVLVEVHTMTGLRVGLAAAFVAVAVWVTQLRPRAAAYPDTLVLKNSLRDTHIPLRLIDEVSIRHTLNVWVGDQRYVCIGIGQSTRTLVRGRKRASAGVIGMERLDDYAARAEASAANRGHMHYEDFVVSRIRALVAAAKERVGTQSAAEGVRRPVAWPETVALVVLGGAFVVSLLV